jgi:hypothetical protein
MPERSPSILATRTNQARVNITQTPIRSAWRFQLGDNIQKPGTTELDPLYMENTSGSTTHLRLGL